MQEDVNTGALAVLISSFFNNRVEQVCENEVHNLVNALYEYSTCIKNKLIVATRFWNAGQESSKFKNSFHWEACCGCGCCGCCTRSANGSSGSSAGGAIWKSARSGGRCVHQPSPTRSTRRRKAAFADAYQRAALFASAYCTSACDPRARSNANTSPLTSLLPFATDAEDVPAPALKYWLWTNLVTALVKKIIDIYEYLYASKYSFYCTI